MFFDFFFTSIAAVCLALALFFTSQRVSNLLTIFSLSSLIGCLTLASVLLYRVGKQSSRTLSGLEFTLDNFTSALTPDVTTLQVSFFLAAVITSLIYLALILTRAHRLQSVALFYFIFIVSAATLMLVTSAVIFIFLCFELLLLASLGLLKLTSKSERVLEAMEEMFL
jgi:formate hydrogenlyase subunit 3/multisubunit Na+/H+ antiporter MnhD subunit